MGLISKELGRTAAYITATASGNAQTLVTNSTTVDTIVASVVFHNTHSSAITVTICVVLDNGGAVGTDAATDEVWQQSIAASDTEVFDIPISMTDTNDTIQVYASVASKVNAFAYGYTLPDQS